MDNFSVRRLVNSIAAVVPRNYVIMEVQANLIEADRKETLKRFSAPHFRKVAHVVMGEPSAEYKKMELEKMEKERKKQIAERQKQLAEAKKKFEEERKKKAEEEKKKKAEEAGEGEKKDEEKKEEEKKED